MLALPGSNCNRALRRLAVVHSRRCSTGL